MERYTDFWEITGDALEHACRRLGLDLPESDRASLMEGWLSLQPYADADQALAMMAPRPLAVLSNGSPGMLEESLRRTNLRGRFAHVISVAEVRTYKPHPAVYELAERYLTVPRDRILFVSGNGWDAAGARSFGLPVALVNRFGQPAEALPASPESAAPDLATLARRLPAPPS